VTEARREFRHHYNLGRHDCIPSCHAIKTWVKNFEGTGLALKKKNPPGRNRACRSAENIEAVQTKVGRNPRRSLMKNI